MTKAEPIEGQFVCETMSDYDRMTYLHIAEHLELSLTPLPEKEWGMAFRIIPATEHPYHVDMVRMAFNWRIIEHKPDHAFNRFWVFFGSNRGTFAQVLTEAHRYAGKPDDEPRGWVRSWDGRVKG